MSVLFHIFDGITIAKVKGSKDLRQILVDSWLESETIIIKPNWVTNEPADFTESRTLRTLFEALDSRIVVTESHCLARAMNLLKDGMNFNVGDREVSWKWLLQGEGWNWLVKNPDWNWFRRNGHYDQIKREEETFLDEYGFTDLFKEFDVNYINVTDEVWSGRTADPTEVKRLVETRFKPVQTEKLYRMVPKKLYDLQGSTFISFAKLKRYATFTIKNIFGMIPDPLRPWWHGSDNLKITSSIIDINKVYHSLFNVFGFFEAMDSTGFPDPKGEFMGTYGGKYNIVKGLGVVGFGRDLVSLDSILLNLTEPWITSSDNSNRKPIELAEKEGFGIQDRKALREAKTKVGDWLSPQPF